MKIVVDVREPNEYATGHVAGAVNLPLSAFEAGIPVVAEMCRTAAVQLVCKSGMRANDAKNRVLAVFPDLGDRISAGVGSSADGESKEGPAIPIMRQVLLIAGLLVAGFGLAAVFAHPLFVWGAVAVGSGLAFAGATGICGMAMVLKKLPWNK